VDILRQERILYSSFDILTDDEVRQELKAFANWPTFPQLWIQGELMGGLDIVREMVTSGDLQSMVPPEAKM
jgi:glutaredoxin-related protein